jgi:hypothetical protein
MIGQHINQVHWKVGDRVAFDREPHLPGTITHVDDPDITVEVVWDDDPESGPEVRWANRLVAVHTNPKE